MAASGIERCGRSQDCEQHGWTHRLGLAAVLSTVPFAFGCEPEVLVGTWSCGATANSPNPATDGGASLDGGTNDAGAAMTFPWASGFEDGFCGYAAAGGFCYKFDGAFDLVTFPVHSGRFAAAFTIDSTAMGGAQARCVNQGGLPAVAYYGAWYFIPSLQTNGGNWNLFHFQGGPSRDARLHYLWDVSLANDTSGNLSLMMRDFVGSVTTGDSAAPTVPIGAWFHLQFFMRRAADATGEITLYQDGVVAFHLVNIVTDDSTFGQWYVGNLASMNALTPPSSTIYVDDVEIGDSL